MIISPSIQIMIGLVALVYAVKEISRRESSIAIAVCSAFIIRAASKRKSSILEHEF